MKVCIECGLELPVSSFYLCKGIYPANKCKNCANKQAELRRKSNREHARMVPTLKVTSNPWENLGLHKRPNWSRL